MNLIERISHHFNESIATKQASLSALQTPIAQAAQLMTHCLLNGGKIFTCGNGISSAAAQAFSSTMLNRYESERPGLPVIALTTDSSTITSIANDHSYDRIFARQIEALGLHGDCLLAISTSGNSGNIVKAIDTAHERGMTIITLSGRTGGEAAHRLSVEDIEIRIPSNISARIQETHLLVLHCLCDLIDQQLLGK